MKHLNVVRLVPRTLLSTPNLKARSLSKDAALLATAIANLQGDRLEGLRPFVPLNANAFDAAASELAHHGIVGIAQESERSNDN